MDDFDLQGDPIDMGMTPVFFLDCNNSDMHSLVFLQLGDILYESIWTFSSR